MNPKRTKSILWLPLLFIPLSLGACLASSLPSGSTSGATHEGPAGVVGDTTTSPVATVAEPNNSPMPTGNVAPAPDPTDGNDQVCRQQEQDGIWLKNIVSMTPLCRRSSTSAIQYRFQGKIEDPDGKLPEGPRYLTIIDRINQVVGTTTTTDLQHMDLALPEDLTYQGTIETQDYREMSYMVIAEAHSPFLPYDVELKGAPQGGDHAGLLCTNVEMGTISSEDLPECSQPEAIGRMNLPRPPSTIKINIH